MIIQLLWHLEDRPISARHKVFRVGGTNESTSFIKISPYIAILHTELPWLKQYTNRTLNSEKTFHISTSRAYRTPNRTLIPIFWYQKMIFWYQKFDFLISEIILWYQKIGIQVLLDVPFGRAVVDYCKDFGEIWPYHNAIALLSVYQSLRQSMHNSVTFICRQCHRKLHRVWSVHRSPQPLRNPRRHWQASLPRTDP